MAKETVGRWRDLYTVHRNLAVIALALFPAIIVVFPALLADAMLRANPWSRESLITVFSMSLLVVLSSRWFLPISREMFFRSHVLSFPFSRYHWLFLNVWYQLKVNAVIFFVFSIALFFVLFSVEFSGSRVSGSIFLIGYFSAIIALCSRIEFDSSGCVAGFIVLLLVGFLMIVRKMEFLPVVVAVLYCLKYFGLIRSFFAIRGLTRSLILQSGGIEACVLVLCSIAVYNFHFIEYVFSLLVFFVTIKVARSVSWLTGFYKDEKINVAHMPYGVCTLRKYCLFSSALALFSGFLAVVFTIFVVSNEILAIFLVGSLFLGLLSAVVRQEYLIPSQVIVAALYFLYIYA